MQKLHAITVDAGNKACNERDHLERANKSQADIITAGKAHNEKMIDECSNLRRQLAEMRATLQQTTNELKQTREDAQLL
ncbi:hypothetical protein RSW84_27475, partial [Escherichia coli]|uniref:hypothetical protein n=1 Tax=Escherichia coli TaxID=562 RepID=UPI0028DFE743